MNELDKRIRELKDVESPMWENLPGYEEAYRRGYEAGCNARQPKPCVWAWDADLASWTTGCSHVPVRHYGEYCHMCGGKIEESE